MLQLQSNLYLVPPFQSESQQQNVYMVIGFLEGFFIQISLFIAWVIE